MATTDLQPGGGGAPTAQPLDLPVATDQPVNEPNANGTFDFWIHDYSNPYFGKGGITNDLNQQAWAAYKNIFGRAPTNDELAQASAAFSSGDPHQSNMQQGLAYVSQAHQALNNTPDQLYADQQKKYLAAAPQYADQINKMFQSTYGRAASQDELDHFGSALASGTQDPYQLQQFLQQQPEYTKKQNADFQSGLATQLQGNDQTYFKNNILPSIQEAYAKQGRSFDSSGFANSATQSAQQQNNSRDQFLAQLSAQQYGGVQQNAYNDYANQVANNQALTNAGINAQYGQVQNLQGRDTQFADYATQANSYNQYLAQYGKRAGSNGFAGAASGAATGAALGTGTGGPGYGTAIGAGVGAVAGYFGSRGNY